MPQVVSWILGSIVASVTMTVRRQFRPAIGLLLIVLSASVVAVSGDEEATKEDFKAALADAEVRALQMKNLRSLSFHALTEGSNAS